MNISIILDFVIIACALVFALESFEVKRMRARWAKRGIVLISVIGVVRGIMGIILDTGFCILSDNIEVKVDRILDCIAGIIIGLIISLILSRELRGVQINAENKENN
jgi:hypothetical protein